jgi:hypothetical protein
MVVWMGDEPDVRAWVNADQAAGEFRVRYAELFDAEAPHDALTTHGVRSPHTTASRGSLPGAVHDRDGKLRLAASGVFERQAGRHTRDLTASGAGCRAAIEREAATAKARNLGHYRYLLSRSAPAAVRPDYPRTPCDWACESWGNEAPGCALPVTRGFTRPGAASAARDRISGSSATTTRAAAPDRAGGPDGPCSPTLTRPIRLEEFGRRRQPRSARPASAPVPRRRHG